MSRQDTPVNHPMQQSQQSPMPIDPALALYPPYYTYQPQQQMHPPPPHPSLTLPQHYSSPSSQGSESLGTPPMDHMSFAAENNIKRSSSAMANNIPTGSRKKVRKDDEDDSVNLAAEKEETKAKPTRGARACTVCRRLKMKCVGAEQGPPCKRCQAGNHQCVFEESNRGKRSSKKHELLTRSLRKMERTLDTVLRSIHIPDIASGMVSRSPSPSTQTAATQALMASPSPPPSTPPSHQPPISPKLHSLPDNSLNPLGLLAEASLANRRAQLGTQRYTGSITAHTSSNGKVGVASDNYFKPGPMTILPLRRIYIERQVQPEMLSFVNTEDVVGLFNVYFDHINMHVNLLDRDFHTPSLICSRSPFLLTTICAISAKFYTRSDLHPRLTELAKKLSYTVPAAGYKSVEIVQAYLLLSLWGCGAVERYEQDKTWMTLGMAIRMATDLNLHRKTTVQSHDTPEGRARDREVHNRERTWILCYCLDRSFSAQMGKPHSIREDFILRNVTHWYRAPAARPGDATIASYSEFQRIMSRCLDILYSGTTTASGLQTDIDYLLIIKSFESQMEAWRNEWVMWKGAWGNKEDIAVAEYKRLIAQFYFNYALLLLNSFGLHNAMERSPADIAHFFARCHHCATACATLVRDELGPSGYLKYSPDSHFVQTSYAVLTLLKLIRPEFQAFHNDEQQTISLVKDVADVLENIAANSTHTPALYSSFLRALISAKTDPPALSDESMNSPPGEPPESSTDSVSHVSGDVGQQQQAQPSQSNYGGFMNGLGGDLSLNEFQLDHGEMGPVADISTFPPTMMTNHDEANAGMLSMDILSSGFWDSLLMPGYSNTMEGISGGFVYGAGGSGLITPHFGQSPAQSGSNTPSRQSMNELSQHPLNAGAFEYGPSPNEGLLIKGDV